jgi:hypothetical protein
MIRRVEILTVSSLYNAETQEVDFGKATSEDLVELLSKDPKVMVPIFRHDCRPFPQGAQATRAGERVFAKKSQKPREA